MAKFKSFDELFESEDYQKKFQNFLSSKPEHQLLRGATEWLNLMSDTDIAYIMMYMYAQTGDGVLVNEMDSTGFQQLKDGEVDEEEPDEESKPFRKPINKHGSTPVFLSLEILDPMGKWETHGKHKWWNNPTDQCTCTIDGKISWTLSGSYHPATIDDPAEFPELEIEDASLNFIEIERPEDTNLTRLSNTPLEVGYTRADLNKLAVTVLDCRMGENLDPSVKLPEALVDRIKEIVSKPEIKQRIDKLMKNVQTKFTSKTFNI